MPKRKPPSRRRTKSLASSGGFETFAIDQLSRRGEVLPRKMFGGVGLYCDGLFFALIARDELYLKVDDQTRPGYEAEGMGPARIGTEPEQMVLSYYEVPPGALEAPDELRQWVRDAIAVAERAATRRRPRRGKRR